MSEKNVKDALKKYLKSIGAYYYMPVNMGYGAASIDFFVCQPKIITPQMVGQKVGLFRGIEAKNENIDEPTKRQEIVMNAISEAGGLCWLENSTDLEYSHFFLS